MADTFTIPATPAEPDSAPTAAPVPGPAIREEHLKPATKIAYAMGGTTDIFGHWLYNGMVDPVFNVFLGVSPTRVSMVRAMMLVVDACSGLLFGWLSDNTRTRWGRRRPYILFGSIAAGLALPCLFAARPSWGADKVFWFMLISTFIFSPIIAAYNTPYQSLGAELTPDYNERTTVMAYKGFTQKAAGALLQGGLWFSTRPMWNDPITGKADVARGAFWWAAIMGAWMIASGIANFVFVRERYYGKVQSQGKANFAKMFGDAARCKPFLIVLGTAFVYAVPTGLVGTLGFYSLTYHVYHGDMTAASSVHFWGGFSYMAAGFVGILVARKFAAVVGKKKTLFATLIAGLFAFVSSWWFYTPGSPWLSLVMQGLNGFSATGLWVVLPSMQADVIDYDELHSGQRRESAYTATFSWVMKLGMVLSMLIGGPLLEFTGFDAALGGNQTANAILGIRTMFVAIPVVALVIALVLVRLYPLSTERMQDIRRQLEARRGTV
jgi:GPH family glycoside/pentoside/hexuronide:cation symporter